ncbi:hypothetical protein KUV47_17520 [Vannielia litorea]|uniref:hypothetical protein n=1 Tax=Vannielia TaxID=2813041 RepID=UPI001C93D708|nr:hypothetical protein [Vannielia litorea]MBY6049376.1 hypothetical protein [Vannielia litorea]MBY6076790.1 hypothetical protein [Vannielia litorea]MBY6155026.1 hypothetical protein [Vannielia litorea]
MFKILTTAAFASALATSAFAGGFEEPDLEGEVFVEESGSSASSGPSLGGANAGPIIGGVLALAVIGALAGSDDDTAEEPTQAVQN